MKRIVGFLVIALLGSCAPIVRQISSAVIDGGECGEGGTCQVKLTWEASPDTLVTGYKIYWGTSTGVYTKSKDVGNVTVATISGLSSGTYYFVATAYDATDESGYSNEASTTTGIHDSGQHSTASQTPTSTGGHGIAGAGQPGAHEMVVHIP